MSLPDSSSDMCGFCGYKSFLIDYYVGIICVWGGKICVTAPSSVFTVLLHTCSVFLSFLIFISDAYVKLPNALMVFSIFLVHFISNEITRCGATSIVQTHMGT